MNTAGWVVSCLCPREVRIINPNNDEVLTLPDGRQLAYVCVGDPVGVPVVWHSGTPQGAGFPPSIVKWVQQHPIWLIGYSRPGYGASTRKPGYRVVDAVADVLVLCEALGIGRFATMGGSGGGPYALACAAKMPDRVHRAAVFSSLAPYPADNLDYWAGMSPHNVQSMQMALADPDAFATFLREMWAGMSQMTPEDLMRSLDPSLLETHRDQIMEDAVWSMEHARHVLASGVEGWADDARALLHPWGFSLAEVAVPVTVVTGDADEMVPAAHAHWLAERLPQAQLRIYPQEGHVATAILHVPEILAELVAGD
ncbi:MAG: alpha/beta hydrolase [Sulfobacillus acidophilus]|uniref:Alpha/beta hydrolase n=1 Tax=Sulfobacillus acidophilus TaxID=53633 RepID=A0A2T2WKI1_9FIRM|nr:MAG: alpha/beta hydrolase [Sulfobacillus acidophilus]